MRESGIPPELAINLKTLDSSRLSVLNNALKRIATKKITERIGAERISYEQIARAVFNSSSLERDKVGLEKLSAEIRR